MTVEPERMTGLHEALSNPDVTLRRTAVWLLGLTGKQSAARMLEVKLDDPDAVVVLRAAEAMHRLGSGAGRERVRVLTRHSQHRIRYYATRLLGRMGEKEDIPLLERLCQSRFLDVKFGRWRGWATSSGSACYWICSRSRTARPASWPPGNSAKPGTRRPSRAWPGCSAAPCRWNGRRRPPPLSGSAAPGSPGGPIFSRRRTPGAAARHSLPAARRAASEPRP